MVLANDAPRTYEVGDISGSAITAGGVAPD